MDGLNKDLKDLFKFFDATSATGDDLDKLLDEKIAEFKTDNPDSTLTDE